MAILLVIIYLVLPLLVWYCSAYPRLYGEAKKTGLPIYFSPVSPNNPLWLVIASVAGRKYISPLMPRILFERIQLTIPGWEIHNNDEVNKKLGVNFVLVGPGTNTIYISDPEVGHTILARRKEFGLIEITSSKNFHPTLRYGIA